MELRALPVVIELDLDLGGDVRLGVNGGLKVCELAGLAGSGVHEGLEERGKAKGAGVNDTVLLEDGKQLGRARYGLVRLDDKGIEHVVRGDLGLLELIGLGGDVTKNREDGALDRLSDGLEGNLYATAPGVRDVSGRGVLLILGVDQALGNAAQNLARDDARVAAGTHERSVRDGLGNVLDGGVRGQGLHLAHHRVERERHVGAGITVGNGEDVKLVDLFCPVLNDLCGCREARADDGGNHLGEPLLLAGCLTRVAQTLDVNLDVNVFELGNLLEQELDGAREVPDNGGHVDALLNDDVQVNRDATARGGNVDALPQALGRKEPGHTGLLVNLGHADDAVALERGIAGKVCDAIVGHPQRS